MAANPSWIIPVAVGAAAAVLVAGAGMTMTELGPWYQGLQQPMWAPPDWAFGVIWTVIFSLTTIGGVNAWRAAPDRRTSEALIGMLAFNGFLNLLWSFLFFKMQRPDWALIEVALLWLSILALILMTMRYARTAALLFMPYLVWVTIAAALNYEIVVLNSPFA